MGIVSDKRHATTPLFNFELCAARCYSAAMSRKDASESHHGWSDFIGVGLLAAAVLLLLAQLSFDRGDISTLVNPVNKPLHN